MERLETAFHEYDALAMTARDVNELYTAILASGALDEMWAWFRRQEGGAA